MRKIILLLFICFTLQLQAQNWELGLTGGASLYQGDIVEPDFAVDNAKFGYGLFLQRNFNDRFGLRLGFNNATLGADDRDYDRSVEGASDPLDFETNISQAHLRLDYNLLGRYKKFYTKEGERITDSVLMLNNQIPLYNEDGDMYDSNVKRKRNWSPFVTAGPSLTFLNENLRNEDLNGFEAYEARPSFEQEDQVPGTAFSFLIGGGINFFLGESLKLGIEYTGVAPFTDYLDGVSKNRNPDNNDWYSFAFVKLSTSLSPKDTDGDGILDKNDKCPETPGLEELDGCPDMDGDGITDRVDKCPETPGVRALRGCPDTDGDGIADKDDDCPQLAGSEEMNGCPDTDGDGVIDPEDNCVNTPGIPEYAGCLDSDGDGIIDNLDDCPKVKGVPALNGCPDTDGDGIADSEDDCPELAGVAAENGCPKKVAPKVIEKKDAETLEFAAQNVEFETNSNKLTEESSKVLDEVATILNKYEKYKIRISGHTDNVGNEDYNQQLSEDRAKACWEYFYQKAEVDASRMSFIGYGETKPIGDNSTSEGRQKNRRVEFELVQE